jgi:flagellar biosynthesis/type III secretory pathway M-ring protein FliF/YscJ
MDTWIILLIIAAVLVVLAIAFVASRRARDRRLEGKREEAQELRSTGEMQAQRAEERAAMAEEQAEQARKERAQADERLRRADEVDPDVEDSDVGENR